MAKKKTRARKPTSPKTTPRASKGKAPTPTVTPTKPKPKRKRSGRIGAAPAESYGLPPFVCPRCTKRHHGRVTAPGVTSTVCDQCVPLTPDQLII